MGDVVNLEEYRATRNAVCAFCFVFRIALIAGALYLLARVVRA
jgi:hypothetical protein